MDCSICHGASGERRTVTVAGERDVTVLVCDRCHDDLVLLDGTVPKLN